MASARDVWEVSRAILDDRDGLVAVIRIYMDESGTHDGSPVVTVGAYIGRAKHWKLFTRDWNKTKRPVRVFHSVDCANLRDEFEGWSKDDRDNFVAKLLAVIPRYDLQGLVVGINLHDFNTALKDRGHLKELLGSPYATCFQWAVSTIMDDKDWLGNDERIAFFHENNNYQTEALEAFSWVRNQRHLSERFMSLTFGTKGDYTPLQAADVIAYEGNKHLRADPNRIPRRALTALDPDKKGRVRIRYYNKDNMGGLVKKLEEVHGR